VKSTSTNQLCPLCWQQPKDKIHFLACDHPNQVALCGILQNKIQELHKKHAVDLYLYQLLWQDITSVTITHDLQEPQECYPPEYQPLFNQQATIGWSQLFNGQIAQSWIQRLTNHSQQTNGIHFYAKILQYTWQYIVAIWKDRNTHLHDPKTTYDKTQLQQAVKQIFYNAEQHPDTQAMIKDQNPELILAQPIKQIKQWIERGTWQLWASAKAEAIRAKLNMQDIWTFFLPRQTILAPQTTDKNLLQPP